jgi:hypothetical protein
LGRTGTVTTSSGLCILKVGGKSKCDLLSAAGKNELIFCFVNLHSFFDRKSDARECETV